MTTYTAITNTETGFEKPLTISLVRRLRDNALAIQEGDATAPNLLLGVGAKYSAGAIGTIALLCYKFPSVTITAGDNIAGSNLFYVGFYTVSGSSPFLAQYVVTGGVQSGTWKALGTASGKNPVLTFVRIS